MRVRHKQFGEELGIGTVVGLIGGYLMVRFDDYIYPSEKDSHAYQSTDLEEVKEDEADSSDSK